MSAEVKPAGMVGIAAVPVWQKVFIAAASPILAKGTVARLKLPVLSKPALYLETLISHRTHTSLKACSPSATSGPLAWSMIGVLPLPPLARPSQNRPPVYSASCPTPTSAKLGAKNA